MRVLIACEISGITRETFRSSGHDAWSCDLLPATDSSLYHIQDNALLHLEDGWDLLIAHPPCTRLCNSGSRWLAERNLWGEMDLAAKFFRRFWDCSIPRIALENPAQHKYAKLAHGLGEQSQIIHPRFFGQPFKKATCLWLKQLPLLRKTHNIPKSSCIADIHNEGPNLHRQKHRSKTYQCFADAFVSQWGNLPVIK